MTFKAPESVKARIRQANRLRLFLDYDGTLAEFAPTPEYVEPRKDVIALVNELAQHPHIQSAVISGRRLGHVEELLPVPGILLAGTYGVELRLPDGEQVNRAPFDQVRPVLRKIKPFWRALIAGREGFFLEDKGWALAMHALRAADDEAADVLAKARQSAAGALKKVSPGLFRLLGGHKFLEVGPALAHKGTTVEYLLARFPSPDALPVYVGDDDKDEEAFTVIHAHGGVAVRVSQGPCDTEADGLLASPQDVRRWLQGVAAPLE